MSCRVRHLSLLQISISRTPSQAARPSLRQAGCTVSNYASTAVGNEGAAIHVREYVVLVLAEDETIAPGHPADASLCENAFAFSFAAVHALSHTRIAHTPLQLTRSSRKTIDMQYRKIL